MQAGEPAAGPRWDRVYLALYALYFGVGLGARLLGWVHFDSLWFVEAARRVLDGSFDLYSFRASPDIAPPDGLAFSYSPLTALLIAPFVGLADALGWPGGADRLLAVPLLLADVLAMEQLRRLVRAWRPAADERFLFLGILATLGLTGFWAVTAFRGHQEGLVLLCLLLTLRLTPRSLLWGGLFAGLTLAAKHTAVLLLIPIGLVLLAGGWHHGGLNHENAKGRKTRNEKDEGRESSQVEPLAPTAPDIATLPSRAGWAGLRDAAVWSGLAVGVFALFMLPALLRNWDAVWYAFVTQEGRRVLLGPGLPAWIDLALQAAGSAADYAGRHMALLQYANVGLVALGVGAPLIAVVWARRRGRPIGVVDARLPALIAFGGLAQIVFAKWVSGHYYQLPLALLFLWDAVRTAPRPGPGGTPPPDAAPTAAGRATFPWIGLGAALAFRSITPIDTTGSPWFRDALLFALFAAALVATLRGLRTED